MRSESVTAEGLAELARRVWKESGLTYREGALRFGVSHVAMMRAVDPREGPRYIKLQRRIVEEVGGAVVQGPVWHVQFQQRPDTS